MFSDNNFNCLYCFHLFFYNYLKKIQTSKMIKNKILDTKIILKKY